MQITFQNPSSYKTERKPATLINIAYIMFLLFGAILTLQSSETHAYKAENHIVYCESSFNKGFFNQVSRYDKKRCDLIYKKMEFEFETGLYKPYQK